MTNEETMKKSEGDGPDGVYELSLPSTLPSNIKSFYGCELLRLVEVQANYTSEPIARCHVTLADGVFETSGSWGIALAEAAWAIARDYNFGDVSEIRTSFLEWLGNRRKSAIFEVVRDWQCGHPTVTVDAETITNFIIAVHDENECEDEDDDPECLKHAERWLRDHPGEKISCFSAWGACVVGGAELLDADDDAWMKRELAAAE